ncbi:MAG: ABC transporter permease, partial [Beijerinckiaceae bacterium]
MLVYLIRRFAQAMLVVAVMATVVFVAMYAVADPVDILAPQDATEADRQAIAQRLGLDKPLWQQFLIFGGNALRGDLGKSFVYNEPSLSLIL